MDFKIIIKKPDRCQIFAQGLIVFVSLYSQAIYFMQKKEEKKN
jgi:hypothetical protein